VYSTKPCPSSSTTNLFNSSIISFTPFLYDDEDPKKILYWACLTSSMGIFTLHPYSKRVDLRKQQLLCQQYQRIFFEGLRSG
jgi:hypothetical protein